jgi:hypothetical protein
MQMVTFGPGARTSSRRIEARSLKMLTTALQANFSRRPDKIVVFDRSIYPGKLQPVLCRNATLIPQFA